MGDASTSGQKSMLDTEWMQEAKLAKKHKLRGAGRLQQLDAKQKSALDIEREQEAKLAKKYGGLVSKKKLMPKDHKFFDSADWALSKQGHKPADEAEAAPGPPPTALPPKLEPDTLQPRRSSHLGDGV